MIGIACNATTNFGSLLKEANRAAFKNVSHAAATIRKDVLQSIRMSDEPSRPGTPPNTRLRFTRKGKVRKGAIQAAVVYAADRSGDDPFAMIGPRHSVLGEAGAAHEFGGMFRGDDYPERPFMGPALDRNLDRFGESFRGSIGE